MRVNKIIGFIVLLLLSLTSCEMNEPNFTVKGKYVILEDSEDFGNTKVYLYKMTNPSPSQKDLMLKKAFKEISSTTISKNGEFSFNGYVTPNEPQIYFVGIARPEALFFSGIRENIVELFVAEPGEISITLDVPHFNNTVIKGTPINEKLTEIFFYPLYLTDSLRYSYSTSPDNESGNLPNRDEYVNELLKRHEIEHNFGEKYYNLMKENAKNDVGIFFQHAAKEHLNDDQIEEIIELSEGAIDFEDNW